MYVPISACQLQALESQLADSALPPQVGTCYFSLPVTAHSNAHGSSCYTVIRFAPCSAQQLLHSVMFEKLQVTCMHGG